jgi:hypothetical protein
VFFFASNNFFKISAIKVQCKRLHILDIYNIAAMLKTNSPKVKIESKQIIFRQIGAILALSLVFLAFEYKTDEINTMNEIQQLFDNTSQVEVIPQAAQETPQLPMPSEEMLSTHVQLTDEKNTQNGFDIDASPFNNDSFE